MQLIVRQSPRFTGVVQVPGDKSISHRVLILGALAEGESHIQNWVPSGDCRATLDVLRALGVRVEEEGQSELGLSLVIDGVGREGFVAPDKPLDCRGSGTTMRLVAGLLAMQPFKSILDGHNGLRRRPMERVARPLRLMGAQLGTSDGKPPLYIQGRRLQAIDFEMSIPSAQVKSAILLAGLGADGKTVVRQPGPTRDHTERLLRAQGVPVFTEGNVITLDPAIDRLKPLQISVPGDMSSAAFLIVAAVLAPDGELRLEEVNYNETRIGLIDVLRRMGADIETLSIREHSGEPVADLRVRSSPLVATEVGGDTVVRMIDEFPVFAVAATQARGRTIVRDAAELAVKESDRIKTTVSELRKLGAQMIAGPDGFEVHGPTRLKGSPVNSHGDHRLAMALAIAGLIAEGETVIDRADVIADSYPDFARILQSCGAKVAPR
jgi:3-phosphoshikimate 1-carboxyvinyltransferase